MNKGKGGRPMRCPLLVIGRMNSNDPSDLSYTDCLKEECAWWDVKLGKCAGLGMAIALQDIHAAIHDISSKISVGGKR